MHVISKKAWRDAVAADPSLEEPMSAWYKVASEAKWQRFFGSQRFESSNICIVLRFIVNDLGLSFQEKRSVIKRQCAHFFTHFVRTQRELVNA
jgi:mRNA-degrading endonuclease HigB of HigAB toxin-antitoxin module